MKKYLLLLTLISCSDKDLSVKNKEVVNSMFEAFNAHSWEKMASYYADSASFLDPSFGAEYVIKSRSETSEKYKGYESMMPDIHDQIVSVEAVGDKVFVEFISTGTIKDGPTFKLPIVSILTIKDRLIVKDATYYDSN
ncbi:MAG: nuclear transport factor 2 family protein [Cyclobacteriaceae bacterium]|nr:nuclear transport factor 2 family protein [Cyclobacteriaceae bacterium]